MAETIKAYRADPYSHAEARQLSEQLGLSEPVAITLVRRGYRTPEEARAFLEADESHEPGEFESMGAAVVQILAAIEGRRRITVHGDFDVDGVCATSILVGALRELGADCDWLIPDRLTDGYGLTPANVEILAERGTELLITVDCGVTAVEEVAKARTLGMDVIVTDHHQPADQLPDCTILHPALDGYPFKELCGTAVAWKLSCALRGADADANADLDLVALATVADVVPLVGENRSLVKRGLEHVRRMRRPGIKALIEAAKCEPTRLDEGDLAFRLAPRINAAGRLYRADAGVELFLTDDPGRAAEIANELSRANGERRATEREVANAAEAARRELPERLRDARALVVAGEGWHPGVIGIVASRLVEHYHRPTIVISLDGEGGGRGSGRSIPGFDLLAGLEACSEHLTSFGGHRAAAGLALDADRLEAFRDAFAAHAGEMLRPEDLTRTERIDAMVGGADLGLDLAEELGRLAPFGMGNPGVRLLVPAARVRDVRPMGQEGRHARFSLHSGAHRALGVSFGRSKFSVGDDDPVDAAVRLEVNHWNGAVEPRVVLSELYPHEGGEGDAPTAADEAWWERFEAELAAEPSAWPPSRQLTSADGVDRRLDEKGTPEGGVRTIRPVSGSTAATLAELASSGAEVLGLVADLQRRAPMARTGARLAEYAELERDPGLAARFEHVVLVDPPPFEHLDRLASRLPDQGEGFLHPAWGEPERRFALSALGDQLAQRGVLAGVFRDLRDAGEGEGRGLLEALRGSGDHPRGPEAAARCVAVLTELGLVQGAPDRGRESLGVVSSEETDLERSTAYRAYSARYQEGRRFLEGRKQT